MTGNVNNMRVVRVVDFQLNDPSTLRSLPVSWDKSVKPNESLCIHLGYWADAFIQSDLQKVSFTNVYVINLSEESETTI